MLPDRRAAVEREALAAKRERYVAIQWRDFLTDIAGPPDWYFNTTFNGPHPPSLKRAFAGLSRYFREVEADARGPIGYVMVPGYGALGGRLHFHGLVTGVEHLSRERWWKEAVRRFGRTSIKPYDFSKGRAYYIAMHTVSSHEDFLIGGGLTETITDVDVPEGDEFRQLMRRRRKPFMKTRTTMPNEMLKIYVDGAGQRPNGTGSGYAYLVERTGKARVKWKDGLTNNQAEYRAAIYALLNVPERSRVQLLSDSNLMVSQISGDYCVHDPKLRKLLGRVYSIIEERKLHVIPKWIPREENLAGEMLENAKRNL